MNSITKPKNLEEWQFVMFMINTLTFQLEKWASSLPDDAPLLKKYKEPIKHLRNKCRKLIEINNVRPLSEVEESFYEVGDEFHAIMGHIQNQSKVAFSFSLLSFCVMVSTDDFDGLEDFWKNLGIYISQAKLRK